MEIDRIEQVPMMKELISWYKMTTDFKFDDIKPSDLLHNVRDIMNKPEYLQNGGFRYILISCDKDYTILLDELFQNNKELRILTDWVKNNIIYALPELSFPSVEVLIRIFNGMLSKLNIDNYSKDLIRHEVHNNIYRTRYLIYSEELPF